MLSPVVSRTSVPVHLGPGQQALFISDVHLGYGSRIADREREQRLLRVLEGARDSCGHLFIVGDLFDFWFDYRHVVPNRNIQTLASLMRYRLDGVPITYLMGNHDFGHHTFFREEMGIEIHLGDVECEIEGKRFYISHGDGKAHNDTGYLILRSILRNRVVQSVYRWLHPNIGIGLAAATSHGSRDYTGTKDYGTTDGLRDFATQRINEGFDFVVMGHRHKAEHTVIGSGEYINLGHWMSVPSTYGSYRPDMGFQLHEMA